MAGTHIAAPAVFFKNLLFATDFSESSRHALPFVATVAHKFGSRVHLCHVITPAQLLVGAPEAAPYLYEAEREAGAKELENLGRSSQWRGLDVRTIIATGILEDELGAVISKNRIDLIVVGTRGRTGAPRLLLGSAAETICRSGSVPVLTVGPDAMGQKNADFRRVLLPTDFSEQSMKILPYCLELAGRFGSSVTFLHVIPTSTGANVSARCLAEESRHTLEKAVAAHRGQLRAQFLVEFGDTAGAIIRAAKETGADLVAMGIKHGFPSGIHLPSGIAYRVMADAECPVLTLRSRASDTGIL
jgi:nucleotide-binding universal stress UspA family protein